jgi:hypothetical protein
MINPIPGGVIFERLEGDEEKFQTTSRLAGTN